MVELVVLLLIDGFFFIQIHKLQYFYIYITVLQKSELAMRNLGYIKK